MLRKMHIILGAVTLAAILSIGAIAQSMPCGNGPGGPMGSGVCANLDLTKQATFVGTVVGLHMGRGMGFPSFGLRLNDNKVVTIVAGPYRVLLAANYKIAEGDVMSVLAYPSTNSTDTYIAAQLTNSSGSINLRDANGVPAGSNSGMMGGMRGMMGGMGGMMGGNCPMRNATN